jgi:hypothetical protein
MVVREREAAEAIAAWLSDKGFPTELVIVGDIAAPVGGLGLEEIPPPELEVRVVNPDHAEPARQAIADHREAIAELRAIQDRRANRTGTTTAVCEDCGKSSEWPAAEMGTTQVCPHCHNYMDVPDPDEQWDDMDFEAAGEEETEEKPAEGQGQ